MNASRTLFGTLGAIATAVGAGLLLAPELVRGIGPLDDAVTALSAVETATVGVVGGALVLAALLVTARSRPVPTREGAPSNVDSRFERAAIAPPEEATASDGSLTGADIDRDVRRAIEEGGDALRGVRGVLYETATSAHADRAGVPESQAASAVDRGEWTTDPVAARFLARNAELPLGMRLREWLVPARERERRIRRTVAAIERVLDG